MDQKYIPPCTDTEIILKYIYNRKKGEKLMKKIILIAIVIAVVFSFAACSQPTVDPASNPFIGTWDGEAFISEVWTFNEDGTGNNDNSLLPYNFEYKYTETELNIYQEFLGMVSDEPIVYEYTANGDTITLYDAELDAEYVITKK